MNDDLTRPSDDISQWCVVGNSPVLNEVDCVQDQLNEESVGIQPEAILQASMHVLMKQARELAGMRAHEQSSENKPMAVWVHVWLERCSCTLPFFCPCRTCTGYITDSVDT